MAANLPAIHGRHLGADLAELLGRPVKVDNDANCFLWSEVHQGPQTVLAAPSASP